MVDYDTNMLYFLGTEKLKVPFEKILSPEQIINLLNNNFSILVHL